MSRTCGPGSGNLFYQAKQHMASCGGKKRKVQNKIQIHDAHSTRNKTEQRQTRGTKNNRPKKILTPEVSVTAAVAVAVAAAVASSASSAVAAVAAVAGAAAPPAEWRSYIIGTCAIRTSAAKKNKEQECIQTTKKST